MTTRCRGQDSRNLRVELYKYPNCGAEVEIFSDEIKVKCPKCGKESTGRKCLPVLTGALQRANAWEKKGGRN